MGNIVTSPNEKINSLSINFNIGKGKKMKKVSFDISTNIKEDEMGAVLDNWFARTDEYTKESLVEYINSKSHYGFKAK